MQVRCKRAKHSKGQPMRGPKTKEASLVQVMAELGRRRMLACRKRKRRAGSERQPPWGLDSCEMHSTPPIKGLSAGPEPHLPRCSHTCLFCPTLLKLAHPPHSVQCTVSSAVEVLLWYGCLEPMSVLFSASSLFLALPRSSSPWIVLGKALQQLTLTRHMSSWFDRPWQWLEARSEFVKMSDAHMTCNLICFFQCHCYTRNIERESLRRENRDLWGKQESDQHD